MLRPDCMFLSPSLMSVILSPAPEPRPSLCAGILAVCLGVFIGAQHLGEEIHHSLGWQACQSRMSCGLSSRQGLDWCLASGRLLHAWDHGGQGRCCDQTALKWSCLTLQTPTNF